MIFTVSNDVVDLVPNGLTSFCAIFHLAYSSIIKEMNTELVKVDVWFKSNKSTVNILKTHYMMFHRTIIKNKAPDDIVHLCGNNLVSVKNTKFLGVIIDCKLNWSDRIAYIKNAISKSI